MKRVRLRLRALLSAIVVAIPVLMVTGSAALAGVSIVVNPGLEVLGADGFPQCWEQSGYGPNDYSFAVTSQAHSGANAMRVAIASTTGGDRKAMMLENPSCAPDVTPGHQYDLSLWYMADTPDVVITAFRHDVQLGWQYWTDLETLPVTGGYQQASVRTPQVPPNTDQVTWGVTIYGAGTLITDDYSMVDATQPTAGAVCTAGAACTQGVWQVMPFNSPVRAIHAVLMHNGDVLLVAGSGNDPDEFQAGTFTSAVYDPRTGSFTQIPTPDDFFCAGHVQLPDGRILILGGNAAYPAADGSHGYEGLNVSYIFDPATNAYQRVNNLNDGHWYPSATELGNGDVISFGGLRADSTGSVTTEYFSDSQQQWLPLWQVNQTWSFWGLYPAMILLQDGRLFYTGSHVFGDGTPGTGAAIYDYGGNTVTSVPGLQDKDQRDQSMSVLLPPAQAQTVLTMGGGNVNVNPDANRDTDLINLSQPSPTYTPGPLLPTGTLSGGTPETSTQGKMYVSAVLLPNGKVFETGGGLHDREDPVYEASMYDPATNSFTPGMATDPVPRTYHSSAFLLPDGRVMAVGDNPGDGTFDMRVSVYSPPYLFDGPRPQIISVASQQWGYGTQQQITVGSPIVSAELIRPAAVTHSSDPDQRYVDLPMTVNGSSIGLNVTSNPDIAPPGWYMLFVTSADGVPSVAQWVHLT
jgi:hypothetical protein